MRPERAVTEMHGQKMTAYKEGISQAFGEGAATKPIDFGKVAKTAREVNGHRHFQGR